jgi:hypothetical protein
MAVLIELWYNLWLNWRFGDSNIEFAAEDFEEKLIKSRVDIDPLVLRGCWGTRSLTRLIMWDPTSLIQIQINLIVFSNIKYCIDNWQAHSKSACTEAKNVWFRSAKPTTNRHWSWVLVVQIGHVHSKSVLKPGTCGSDRPILQQICTEAGSLWFRLTKHTANRHWKLGTCGSDWPSPQQICTEARDVWFRSAKPTANRHWSQGRLFRSAKHTENPPWSQGLAGSDRLSSQQIGTEAWGTCGSDWQSKGSDRPSPQQSGTEARDVWSRLVVLRSAKPTENFIKQRFRSRGPSHVVMLLKELGPQLANRHWSQGLGRRLDSGQAHSKSITQLPFSSHVRQISYCRPMNGIIELASGRNQQSAPPPSGAHLSRLTSAAAARGRIEGSI